MTVANAIRRAAEVLSDTSDTARLDAELLMAHVLGVSRSDMLLRHQSDEAPSGFNALVTRRATHEPVAYIVGSAEFYGRDFRVTHNVLIPRGDSETLIDIALEFGSDAKRVLDLGTGSGALLVTALLELEGASGIAIDKSQEALKVAEDNARGHCLGRREAEFLRRDWREEGWTDGLGQFDLILCNPPYVENEAAILPDVREFEPSSALFAGKEGLDDYRVIIPNLRKLLSKTGVAVLEIGASQGDSVTEIAENWGFIAEIRRDLANRPRALIIQ